MPQILPVTTQEAAQRGWDGIDFVCITGDAYVDHPSFGIAVVARVLEAMGYRVAVLARPDPNDPKAFARFGRPRLAFFITGGNIDSMVANYTVAKRRREKDDYASRTASTLRPDRACTVYAQAAKRRYPDCPVVLGGLEASLRRFAHYDYWDDAVRPSILADSKADLLVYGMGEKQTRQIAQRLSRGEPISNLTDILGTACMVDPHQIPHDAVRCASFEKTASDKLAYIRAFKQQLDEQDAVTGKAVAQKHGERMLLQNPPMPPLTREELDDVFALPFTRTSHPVYDAQGGVAALEEVEFSVIHNRGCFGHCNFCSIAVHQGRTVVSRSIESVENEVKSFVDSPRFKGYIHDVGGPTANFRKPSCEKQKTKGLCTDRKCLAPAPCPALEVDHSEYLALLRRLRALTGVKKVFIRSGIRFDYLLCDPDETFMRELVEHHVSGQLKVAPEHCSPGVLRHMGKPSIEVYERFAAKFARMTKKLGKEQYLVPYLMSSHPGSRMEDAVALAVFLKKNKLRPEQVQDFYPTPGTASTAMFYTGIDPFTMKPVYIPKSPEEKRRQRALLQFYRPELKALLLQTLHDIKRTDLIGTGPDCLVAPDAQFMREHPPRRSNKEKSFKNPRKEKPNARRR